METQDVRKSFILTTTGNYFNVSLSAPSLTNLLNDEALNNFLDSGSCQLLGALHYDDSLLLKNKIEASNKNEKLLVFFKIKPEVITDSNLQNICVSSMIDSPLSSLYHSLQTLYAPVLLQDAEWSKALDPKLQNLVTELSEGLGSLLRKTSSSDASTSGASQNTMA
ncbi:unnamed protein product, partial [Meganyctiphanes norvegica]